MGSKSLDLIHLTVEDSGGQLALQFSRSWFGACSEMLSFALCADRIAPSTKADTVNSGK